MTSEEKFIAEINNADEGKLLDELRANFLHQPFRGCNFGGWLPPATPFLKALGLRGNVATFRSRFRDSAKNVGLARDFRLASQLPAMGLNECYYGAGSFPLYPFLCELPIQHHAPTGATVLAALHIKDFRSEHIHSLDVLEVPFPGYHPRTANDEIHNDFTKQNIFFNDRPEYEWLGAPGVLKKYGDGQRVWYILLHDWRRHRKGPIVTLFAVVRSPHGSRLVGVVTHQVCHNLCD